VYAIEAGHAVEIAREMIRQNDVEDRVVLINELSYRARVEEPVDVLVTETLWNFGFGEGMLGFFRDASERFLRDGGRIVPAAIEAWLAPVEMPKLYERLDRWPKDCEVDMSVMRSLAMNYVHQVDLDRDALNRSCSRGWICTSSKRTTAVQARRAGSPALVMACTAPCWKVRKCARVQGKRGLQRPHRDGACHRVRLRSLTSRGQASERPPCRSGQSPPSAVGAAPVRSGMRKNRNRSGPPRPVSSIVLACGT
jgi:hypothetical protein